MLHYIDVDLRQGRGRLCFIKRKDKVFLSDNRVVLEEKVWIFRVLPFWIKKVVDFLSKSPFFHFLLPCFHFLLPNFLDKPPGFLALLPHFHIVPPSLNGNARIFLTSSFCQLLRYAYRCVYADTCSHIAYSPSSEFLPPPFTLNHLKT